MKTPKNGKIQTWMIKRTMNKILLFKISSNGIIFSYKTTN